MGGAERRNLSQAVVDDLLTMVQAGQLKAGDRLPTERDLMDRFAVGRNTLREAIQSLVALGVLDVRPGIGTRVRSLEATTVLSPSMISSLLRDEAVTHLYDLRLLLEAEAASRAASEASDEQIAELVDALDRYRKAAERGHDLFPHDIVLHRLIAATCSNPLFGTILDATRDLLTRARELTDQVPGAKQRAFGEHTRIVQAIARRDGDAARTAMSDHLRSAQWALGEARERAKAAGGA